MEEEARDWDAQYPDEPVVMFACRYPGKYREAANAIRKVRRERKDHDRTTP